MKIYCERPGAKFFYRDNPELPDGEPLFEKEVVDIYEIYEFKGEKYVVACISIDRTVALVEKLNIVNQKQTSGSDLICPFCGHRHMDSWELDDGSEHEYECASCGALLEYDTEVIRTITARLKKAPEIQRIG